MKHGARQRDRELLQEVRFSFRYRHPWTECGYDRIVTLNNLFKLGTIQHISLLDRNAVVERLESLGRANKCRHAMTAFNRLSYDLQSRAACGTQYN